MTDIVYGIRITGEAESAKRAFRETSDEQRKLTGAERDNSRAAQELERANERKAVSLNRLRLAAIAAGAAMLAALRSTVNAAVEAERSIARLNAVWTATGGTSGLSRAQMEAIAQRMAVATRFDDESVRDAMAVLQQFRLVSGETFIETMKIAAGLAEVFNTDLRGAVLQLGKALEDPAEGLTQLRRAGVVFSPTAQQMIKDLVEAGRQAEAMTLMLEELKSRGLDVVAEAMNQGLAKATSALGKEWNDLLEAIGRTDTVQATAIGSFSGLANTLRSIKGTIESGDWVEKLSLIDPTGATMAYRSLRGMIRGPQAAASGEADADSPEAAAARRAAADARWQDSFDRQQAQATEFLKKYDERQKKLREEAAKDSAAVAAGYAESLATQQEILDEAAALGVRFLQQQDEKRIALENEAEAVRDTINPWNAYARKVEELRALLDKGAISQREFGEAVALEAKKVAGAYEDMADKGAQSFNELKQAIEGWGVDLSRELARGEVSIRSFGRLFEELLAMQINARAVQPFLTQGTEFLNELLNPTGVQSARQMAAFQAAGAYTGSAAPFHGGGIVGLEGGARRSVHPGYFERAPRLHSGLMPDEFPAVLQRGEGVFTPGQMRAMGGGAPIVKFEVNNQAAPVTARQQGAPRFDGKQWVVGVVLNALAVDGGARQQLRSMLSKPEH
jgi:hypothetical protein